MSKKLEEMIQYKLDVTEALITKMLNVVEQERKAKGEEFALELALSVLASLTLNLVLGALQAPDVDENDPGAVDAVHGSFMDMKASIESAMSSAFSAAMQEFAPTALSTEFTCEIDPVLNGPKGSIH